MNAPADRPIPPNIHCVRLDAGSRWSDASLPNTTYAVEGEALDVSIRVFAAGETALAPTQALGEEIGAILEGVFEVDAAGESYVLGTGVAIVIPPGAPRRWRCRSARGVAYRVVVKPPALPEGAI